MSELEALLSGDERGRRRSCGKCLRLLSASYRSCAKGNGTQLGDRRIRSLSECGPVRIDVG